MIQYLIPQNIFRYFLKICFSFPLSHSYKRELEGYFEIFHVIPFMLLNNKYLNNYKDMRRNYRFSSTLPFFLVAKTVLHRH